MLGHRRLHENRSARLLPREKRRSTGSSKITVATAATANGLYERSDPERDRKRASEGTATPVLGLTEKRPAEGRPKSLRRRSSASPKDKARRCGPLSGRPPATGVGRRCPRAALQPGFCSPPVREPPTERGTAEATMPNGRQLTD